MRDQESETGIEKCRKALESIFNHREQQPAGQATDNGMPCSIKLACIAEPSGKISSLKS